MFQCRMALKPDGLFLAALFGGETLQVCQSIESWRRDEGDACWTVPAVGHAGHVIAHSAKTKGTLRQAGGLVLIAIP